MTRKRVKVVRLLFKAELRTVKKSSVSILKESKSSWQFSRVEIKPGKHSVVINTGMAGKRVGYREPIKKTLNGHASRASYTPFDSCY